MIRPRQQPPTPDRGDAASDADGETATATKVSPTCRALADVEGEPSGWEIAFYAVTLAAMLVYAAADFFTAYGRPSHENLPSHLMKPGWLAEYMDATVDFMETQLIDRCRFLLATSIGFVMVSQVTLRWTPGAPHYLAIAGYTLAVTAAVVNARSAVYMLLLHTGAVCMAYYSLAGVWLMVLAVMVLHNYDYGVLLHHLLHLTGTPRTYYYPIIGYLYCRSISAGHSLNRMLRQQRTHGSETPTFAQYLLHHLPRSLAYGFYLPWHYIGPILTYDEFYDEVTRSDRTAWDLRSAGALIWRGCRLLLWLLVLQAFHHFLPVGAFLYSINSSTPVLYSRLVLAMYLHGQKFMLTYVQYYGWAGLVARVDGVRLPHWPDCVSRVYTYRKMWKVFDRGLASFMQHHIYVPMGGSRHGVIRQVVAVAASFAFVSVYHGDTWGVRAWSVLNAAQLMLEAAACGIYRTRVKNWLGLLLGPRVRQRLVASLISMTLFISSGSMFLFLFPHNSTFILGLYLKPLTLQDPIWYYMVFQYLLYCFVQIALFYEKRVADKQRVD